MARSPTGPVEPLGVATNRFAVKPVVRLKVIVSAVVIGLFATVNQLAFELNPTLVTVPEPEPPVQAPQEGTPAEVSCRQLVDPVFPARRIHWPEEVLK